MNMIETLEAEQIAELGKDIPDFAAGDTIRVGVVRRGRVRRAKLYYLRALRGKSARIAEKTNYRPLADKSGA